MLKGTQPGLDPVPVRSQPVEWREHHGGIAVKSHQISQGNAPRTDKIHRDHKEDELCESNDEPLYERKVSKDARVLHPSPHRSCDKIPCTFTFFVRFGSCLLYRVRIHHCIISTAPRLLVSAVHGVQ